MDADENKITSLCEGVCDILNAHGFRVSVPWYGTMDDRDREKYQGLRKAVEFILMSKELNASPERKVIDDRRRILPEDGIR